MADQTSGDLPAGSTNGAAEGQRDSAARALRALKDEQTVADGDRTLSDVDQSSSDSDQTLSDADQTSSDSDQTSADCDQLAADRDQAQSDRDVRSGADARAYEEGHDIRVRTAAQREKTAEARLNAADQRDAIAHARDLAAVARDRAARDRDRAMEQRDAADEQRHGTRAVTDAEIVTRAAEQRERAAQQHARAAEHRALAAADRHAAAEDRRQAARDRLRAATDPLTGARARAAGLNDLDHEIDRSRRAGGSLVVAYVDVVGLKGVNDSEGHHAGDEMLRLVVVAMGEHLRSYDLVIRLGGDEFLCAMSNVSLRDAGRRFRAIDAALAAAPAAGAITAGFAELGPDETARELIGRADGEMIASRRADRDGRSRRTADTSADAAR